MAILQGFIGGSYLLPATREDSQTSLNLYYERDQSGHGKTPDMLTGSPGLVNFGAAALPTAPVRGIWIGNNRMFVVSGSKLYEVNSSGDPINGTVGGAGGNRGDVGNDGFPVQIFPNGNQLAIVSAGLLYYDNGAGAVPALWKGNTGTVSIQPFGGLGTVVWYSGDQFDTGMIGQMMQTPGGNFVVLSVPSPTSALLSSYTGGFQSGAYSVPIGQIRAYSGTMIDGYAVVSLPQTDQFNISAIKDFSSWNQLDFGNKEGYPDYITSVLSNDQLLYLMGSQTTEIYQDTGAADFPFQRVPGAVLQVGLGAKYSPDKLGTGVAFITSDTRGGAYAVMIQSSQIRRISTYALEQIWKKYTKFDDAVAYSYKDGGHEFWVVSFPTGNQTWAYDLTENLWHQRGYGGDGFGVASARQRGYLHGYVWGKHIVGDYATGQLYVMDTNTLTDAGTAIVRQRAAPHISVENKRTFYSEFTLDVGTGNDTATPTFILDWSKDGANTFGVQKPITGGATGVFTTRLQWRRLGQSRTRTFRVTSTAAIHHNWLAAYVESVQGLN